MDTPPTTLDVEGAVRTRYAGAARQAEAALCCPVQYDARYLDVLPAELIERDYGCGDPSRYVRPGDTLLDLGCGGGKVCYIAAQVVGPQGHVIGVDMNDEMLALARRYQSQIGDAIGYHNTRFFKGRIQDLALDLERFAAYLEKQPVRSSDDWLAAQAAAAEMRLTEPMIGDEMIDVVVSNCVLNLVAQDQRQRMFAEVYRVLRRGGRAVISDIVCDEPVPERLRNDPQLWSGCISGAFVEHEMIEAFAAAGFYGMEIVERQEQPWAVVEGIEFRSMTVRAFKGKDGPCRDHRQAVIYNGPFSRVTDDDGHVLVRGVRTAVCEKTFQIYTRPPYAEQVTAVPPLEGVRPEDAPPFDCRRGAVRDPRETKGNARKSTMLPVSDGCDPGSDCC